MATITGTAGNDSILPGGVSAGVTGGVPGAGSDTVFGTAGNDTIDGGDGTNFLDYSSFTQQININFTGFGIGNVVKFGGTTDQFSNFQRLYAGSGNDFLVGTTATGFVTTWLRGNAGNDQIDGLSSRSVAADYSNSPGAINVNLVTGVVLDGWGGTDTLINVRRVNLSGFSDVVLGSSFGDVFFINQAGGSKALDGGGFSDRGNEVRYALTGALLIDLGSVASGSGGYVGSTVKSNGLVDSLTNFSRAVGGSGNDIILGTPGDDIISGEAGNDTIIGRGGYNSVGYDTNTISSATPGPAVVDLSLGTATDPWGGTDTLIDIQGAFGGTFGDDLKGRDLGFQTRSLMQGFDGNDTIRGAATGFTAADYNNAPIGVTVNLATGTAADGYGGTDTLIGVNAARGGGFADSITGGTTDDWLSGGAGNDTINGGDGRDRVVGDDGNDTLNGQAGNDALTGGNGQDTMTGGTGADRFAFTLSVTPGQQSSRAVQDTITDFSTVEGDLIRFGTTGLAVGEIVYAGSTGVAQAALSTDITLPAFTPPNGLVALLAWFIPHTTTGGWVVVDENRDGVLQSGEFAVRLASALDPAQLRVGGSAVASIIGDAGNNTLYGTGIPEGLRGLGGDDVMYGSGLLDSFAGGDGNDQYVVRNFESAVLENIGEGYDVVWMAVSGAVVGANIEEIRLIDTANLVTGSATGEALVANAALASTLYGMGGSDTLWGTALADTLDGGDGDDIIRSQGGADVMYGGLGNDNFVLSNVGASIIEYINGGYDTAWLAVNNYTLGANVEIGRLAAMGAVVLNGSGTAEDLVANQGEASTLNGNGGNDVLWGSSFADTLNGGAGDDIMRGQGGNDVMAGGVGNDQYVVFASGAVVTELTNEGYDIVYYAGPGTFNLGQNVEEARLVELGAGLIGGNGAELLVGNSSGLGSTIVANGGNDIIFGTAAADSFTGGAGDDTIYSQGGADIFRYDAAGWGVDQIAGFAAGAKLQFAATSGVTAFGQLNLNFGGGNTQVNHANGVILVFGATLNVNDFIFG